MPAKLEHLDDWALALRLWAAQDRIQQHARRVICCMDLDPAQAERIEDAARYGDEGEFLTAVTDLLDEMDASR